MELEVGALVGQGRLQVIDFLHQRLLVAEDVPGLLLGRSHHGLLHDLLHTAAAPVSSSS